MKQYSQESEQLCHKCLDYLQEEGKRMNNNKFVEIELTEKAANAMECDNGCQRASGSPKGG